MNTKVRLYDIPLLNAFPIAVAMAGEFVYRSFMDSSADAVTILFEVNFVRLFALFPLLFAVNLIVGYLACFIARKMGFAVAAAAMVVLTAVACLWETDRVYALMVMMPMLAVMAKRLADNDRLLNVVISVALLCVIGFMAYIVHTGRGVVEHNPGVMTISHQVACALVIGSWLSYYLLPHYVMPGLYMLALVLLFALVPAVSWQIFFLPAFMLLMYWWHCKRYYIAFVVKKERRQVN